jgi:SLT domain-containing protein
MGLLIDKYNEYLERLRGVNLRDDDDFSGMDSDFNTSVGDGIKASLRERESPLMKNPLFPTNIVPPGEGKINFAGKSIPIIPKSAMGKQNVEFAKNNQIPKQDAKPSDPIVMGGSGTQYATDGNFLTKLSNLAGIDLDQAKKDWAAKGGFNGLMANPAFTLGLAFMQAGARGEKLGQNLLDNVLKSSAISEQYKKKLSDKSEILEVTEGDMNQIKEVLGSFDISAPILRRLLPGNQSEKYEQAVEDVAFAVQKRVRKKVLAAQKAGKDIKVGTRLYKEVIQEMIRKGEINKKGGLKLFGYSIIDETLEAREHGGPVHTGKAYVVGEAGPEIMIPKSSGNVVANDDSQVFAMLLASNPQLQKVSKERAMKILKAKFPEYFD